MDQRTARLPCGRKAAGLHTSIIRTSSSSARPPHRVARAPRAGAQCVSALPPVAGIRGVARLLLGPAPPCVSVSRSSIVATARARNLGAALAGQSRRSVGSPHPVVLHLSLGEVARQPVPGRCANSQVLGRNVCPARDRSPGTGRICLARFDPEPVRSKKQPASGHPVVRLA